MPVLDGRRDSCSSKTNSSNCLLLTFQVSSYLKSMQSLLFVIACPYEMKNGRAKANKSNCILESTAVCLCSVSME